MNTLKWIPIAGMLGLLCLPCANAQSQNPSNAQTPSTNTQAQSRSKTDKTTTVTGCLMKGDQTDEYKISDNGTTYDLHSTANVKMADHVGHKVTVTGKLDTSQAGGANTANRTTAERLDVTKLTHVSATCQ
jgi:hypothetical protein